MPQANGLLQAKVDMLRDNLKAARMDASEKARLKAEVARLKERRASSTAAEHSGGLKTSRSTGEDDMGSQTQLWLQLVRVIRGNHCSVPDSYYQERITVRCFGCRMHCRRRTRGLQMPTMHSARSCHI